MRFMPFFVIACCFSLSVLHIKAQVVSWTSPIKGNSSKNLNDMATDRYGNVYSTGSFSSSADFDPGPGTNTLTTAGQFENDMFITKHDVSGNLVWVKQIGTAQNVDAGRHIAVNTNDQLIVIGDLRGTIDFDPGPGVATLTSNFTNYGDIFFLVLDLNGNFVSVSKIEIVSSGQLLTRGLYQDSNGDLILAFLFSGTVDFDPGPTSFTLSSSQSALAISKISSTGTHIWSKKVVDDTDTKEITQITLDFQDNIILSGFFYGTIDFDPGPAVNELVSTGQSDGFVTKYTPDANLIFARSFTNNFELMNVSALTTDKFGNIYCGGFFQGTGDFDPGPAIYNMSADNFNLRDGFMVKLSNQGNFIWAKKFGNNDDDDVTNLIADDSGDIFAFLSFKGTIDADPGTGTSNLVGTGNTSAGLVRLTQDGQFVLAQLFASNDYLWFKIISQTENNGNFYMTGNFTGTADFDPGAGQDLETSTGVYPYADLFIMKFANESRISGNCFLDNNADGIRQLSEPGLPHVVVQASYNSRLYYAYSDSAGNYTIYSDTGNYQVNPALPLYYTSMLPVQRQVQLSSYGIESSNNDFGLIPSSSINDLGISLVNLGRARPGRPTQYRLTCYNEGTNTTSGIITFKPNAQLSVSSSSVPPFNSSSTQIQWNVNNLPPGQSYDIDVILDVDNQAVLGSFLQSNAEVEAFPNDANFFNNKDSIFHLITGSFDPNDKKVTPAGPISTQFINTGKYLDYLIRFQNTGTDTAFLVIIKDSLSQNLDINSFRMISTSHRYILNIKENNILEWTFPNIQLPDSNVNEEASHGYIRFRIKPKSTLITGDEIFNDAAIYFDFNAPVITNETYNVVVSSPVPLQLIRFAGKLEKNQANLYWTTIEERNVAYFSIEYSNNGLQFDSIGMVRSSGLSGSSTNHYDYYHQILSKGQHYYRLKMVDQDGSYRYSHQVIFRFNGMESLSVYPLPAAEQITVIHPVAPDAQLQMIDEKGLVLISQSIPAGSVQTRMDISKVPSGYYFLVWTDGKMRMTKMLIRH